MLAVWSSVRCRVLGRHDWRPVEDRDETGVRCRRCGEELLERYFVERDHDAHLKTTPTGIYTGALGGSPPPTG